MNKIVITSAFASSHFLLHWIKNIQQVIEPDLIIIRECLFKNGPENKGHIDEFFNKKWSYNSEGIVGFDWKETQEICSKFENVILEPFISIKKDVNEVFLDVISFELEKYIVGKTIIFTLEPDAFLFEGDKDVIQEEVSKLKPGQGLKCLWRDFLETQFYCEAINELQPKHRRFCYCFDTIENYRQAINGFMSQSYPKLQFTDKFWIRHYPWFVYDKWKELRYELIYRADPQYWKDFESGLKEIRKVSREIVDDNNCEVPGDERGEILEIMNKICIRPSRQDEGRWARFIDAEHPRHIQNHPNFVK